MTHNWGGIVLQTALARLWVDALSPDILCWHELWDVSAARAAVPPAYEAMWSTADGAGTGFVIAWKRSLRWRPEEATLVFDGEHWMAALLPLWHVGRLLVVNVHLHPKIPYRQWLQQVLRMEQLRRELQPSYTYLAGDLNATDAPGYPLSSALSPSGPLRDYHRVLPTGTTTNHTTVKGIRRATAIDHAFIHGPVAEARHQLLSSPSSHAVIVITVTLLTKSADAWAWRRFRWRQASPSDMDAMGAALDLVWGWLALTPALPDDYVAAHHEVASQLIPRPPHTRQLMLRLAQRSFPLGPDQLDQQLADLREAAEARGIQNRVDVLRAASITAATRTALHLPSPPLEPFSGILPRPEAFLPTREARLNEVLRQSTAQTCNRFLHLNHEFFATHRDPSAWAPMRRPSLELPTVHLLALLRAGLPPDHPDTPRNFLQSLNSRPLLTPESLARRRLGKRTLAVSSDNVTRSLLFQAAGGVQQGLHHSLLQAEAGTPTVLNETVRYGIYKGKPSKPLPRHLARPFRPVDVESAAFGTLSGIASDQLAANLEVSGAYTPVVFLNCTGQSSAFMVLVGRAAVYTSLLEQSSCAICDWDESDAYLRVVREFSHRLLGCLPHVWDYSQWAHNFHSRLVIWVITCEGFAPPFSTGEGGNQGDAIAALHYQAPSHVLTLSLAINWSGSLPLRLPGHSVPLPATKLVYSDDRRFLAPTLPEVVAMADASRDASRRAGRIVHPDKLEYFLARLGHHGISLERSPVPDSEMYTSTTPPELVGIPLLPDLLLHRPANKALTALRNVHKSTVRGPAPPALRLRSLHSFGLSVVDYVASGVLLPPDTLRPHQRVTDAVYSAAFCLPPWVHRSLLRLPLASGGLGAPDVTLRSHLHLLTSYLWASWSTNLLAVAASHLLLTPPPRAGWLPEGLRLRQQLLPLDVALHPCPSPALDEVRFYSSGDITLLSAMHHIVAATVGSQMHHRLGAGVALWHPTAGIFYKLWFGVQTSAGHSTDSEWLAKVALFFLLGDWSGTVLLATDSTAALTANLTRSPRAGTLLLLSFCAALIQLQAQILEVWLPAQHDSGATTPLAQLNAEADRLADLGAREARLNAVPWLPLFSGRVLATHQGRLVLDPRKTAEAITLHHHEAEFAQHFPPPDPTWSSSHIIDAMDNAAIEPGAIHTTMLHRLLAFQRHPPGYGGVVCPYCHLAQPDMADHLQRRCPPFFLQYLTLAWRLLRHPQVFPLLSSSSGSADLHLGTFLATPALVVGLTWNALPSPHRAVLRSAPRQLLLDLNGAWKVASEDPRRPPLLHAQRAAVAADHHVALAQQAPTLRQALDAGPFLWTPTPSPLSAPVLATSAACTLSLRDSVVLGLLLRRCRAWQLSTSPAPCIPLPPASPPQPALAWVVNALGSTPQEAVHMASSAPDNSSLVLLAGACDLPVIHAQLTEFLTTLALPDGVSVGRASGAPLDMHDWPEA